MQIQIQSPLSPPILWFRATGLGELPNTMRGLRRKGYRACGRLCAAQVFAGAKIVELSVIDSPIFGPTRSPPLPASNVPPFSKSAVRLPPHTASRRARCRWVKMAGGQARTNSGCREICDERGYSAPTSVMGVASLPRKWLARLHARSIILKFGCRPAGESRRRIHHPGRAICAKLGVRPSRPAPYFACHASAGFGSSAASGALYVPRASILTSDVRLSVQVGPTPQKGPSRIS